MILILTRVRIFIRLKCDVYEKPKLDNINVCKIKVSDIIKNSTKHNKCTKKVTQKNILKNNFSTNY